MSAFQSQRQALQNQLETIRQGLGEDANDAGPSPKAAEPSTQAISNVVQGVLKQLLTSLLEKQGKLQLVRQFEEEGRARLEYVGPGGKRQVIEDLCAAPDDRRMLETVLRLIIHERG